MTKQEIVAALEKSDIWTRDGFGHFKLDFGPSRYRLKIQSLAIRYERKVGTDWFCKTSDYYKNVEIQDGFLKVKGRRIPITATTLPKPPAA